MFNLATSYWPVSSFKKFKVATLHAEAKIKHLERYHATKTLVKDMTEREHWSAKRKWKISNKKRRERQQAAQAILAETPVSTPRSGTPISPRSRGRRHVRRDRSALYRQNMKLQEEMDKLKKKCNKYKKDTKDKKQASRRPETKNMQFYLMPSRTTTPKSLCVFRTVGKYFGDISETQNS